MFYNQQHHFNAYNYRQIQNPLVRDQYGPSFKPQWHPIDNLPKLPIYNTKPLDDVSTYLNRPIDFFKR